MSKSKPTPNTSNNPTPAPVPQQVSEASPEAAPEAAPEAVSKAAPEEVPSHVGAESETAVSAVPPGVPAARVVAQAAPAVSVLGTPVPDVLNPDKPLDIYRPGVFQELVALFPNDARYLKQTEPVTDEELEDALRKLPDDKRAAFQAALKRMNPIKIGSHTRRRAGMIIFDVRVNHGTGNDETRPKSATEGALYSTDSRILATSDREVAQMLNAPEVFSAYIIFDRRGNTLWPPRDTDQGDSKTETESHGRAPICRSVDGEKGDVNGSCAACPVRPFVNGSKPTDDECRGEIVLYVVPSDFSGLYRFVFNGTNAKAGRTLVNKFAVWGDKWDHPFSIKTKKEVDPKDAKRRWFIVEAEPQRSVAPTAEEREFLLLLARKIDTEEYWPERRRIHLAAAKVKAPQVGAKANLQGLLASAQADAGALPAPPLKDHAKNNL